MIDADVSLSSHVDLSLCYLSGLLAAGTPCVVVLIPLILFRFRGHIDRHLLWFVLGFVISYAALGLVASKVLSSPLQNGIRLGLSGSMVILGTLTINGKINPIDLPFRDNSFLLGVGFAMLISVNPWYGLFPQVFPLLEWSGVYMTQENPVPPLPPSCSGWIVNWGE